MNDIINQCKKLYLEAFRDDEEFTDLLFSCLREKGLEYIIEDDVVISMLFCMDVTFNSLNGKYVYGVVTNPEYRGQGRMSQLFNNVSEKYKGKYDFLCLKPMDEGLFSYYSKLGFENLFKKDKIVSSSQAECDLIKITDIDIIKKIRKRFLNSDYVEYGEEFYKLLYAYCSTYTDNVDNPTFLITTEILSGKVKEMLGEKNKLPKEYCQKELLTVGDGFDFGMVKFLSQKAFDSGYLGFAMD